MDDRTELSDPMPWTVVARNLPEHARNPIHTDAGAHAAGLPRALVAGGSWVHTRSIVRHHGLVPAGAVAMVRSRVVHGFQAHGERALLDVRVVVADSVVADSVVASLEHEAIVRLP
jgi:hypothetical protein